MISPGQRAPHDVGDEGFVRDNVSKFDRLPKTLASVREFNAAKGILVFLTGVLLYFAHAAFIPIALAFLFALVLSSPVEVLRQWGVPRGLSALVIMVLALGAIAGLTALIWTPAQEWYASAPRTLAVIPEKKSLRSRA